MSKWLAFDIETQACPGGDDTRRNLGVTCLAWAMDKLVFHQPVFTYGGDSYAPKMTQAQLESFVQSLCRDAADGYRIATINGLGFDFPVLAAGVGLEYFDNLRDLALNSYDPPFQMLCERGFMVGLDALAVGLELSERKTEDMNGAKAVELWENGDLNAQRKVIEYVRQDAKVTLGIIQALENKQWTWRDSFSGKVYHEQQAIRWRTKRGGVSYHCLENGLLTVRQCLELPLPDVEWMKARGSETWPRSKFTSWLSS